MESLKSEAKSPRIPGSSESGAQNRNDAKLSKPLLAPSDNSGSDGVLSRASRKRTDTLGEGTSADEATDTNDTTDVGEAVIDSVVKTAKSPQKKPNLANDIDGKNKDNRSAREQAAVDEVVKEVAEDLEKKTSVVSTKARKKKLVRTKTGAVVDVTLKNNEKSKVVKAADNSEVLVLNSELTQKDATEETAKFVDKKVDESARKNGVTRGKNSKRRLFRRARRYVRRFYKRIIIRPAVLDIRVNGSETAADRLLDLQLTAQSRQQQLEKDTSR